MGYRGRTGVYELLEMTKDVVEASNHPDPGHFLRAAQAQMAGETMRQARGGAGGAGPQHGRRGDAHQ
ncbi:hypothetical protein LP419_01300 [Massilia sp. H-1]|nr:hypothetical protein LP419_01300 [Massilia sp. H-1]